ncbi:GAF domain-containing protein [Catellatospora methionotrophica]|uniref:GAF domain-containing protein n=1 Tax=Catellatospora methionotrophica TaxID=121620 RepID=A0A8J3PH78_9ACTN|nr:GAF and ANTAR domain-containing protein [Catellatospora methionotrophica]GIG17566.1 GAF domain-containing protein [Catellatospora methionotrophica]
MRIWAQVGKQTMGAPATVGHVCAAAMAGVNVDGAGVTIMAGSTARDVLHASDRVAADLEEWQLTYGQGPCVDAFTRGGPVIAPDLRSSESLSRWPVFSPAALDSGARAVFALPLQIGAIRLGVLDLYRARPGAMSSYELADALAFADATAMMVIDDAAGLQPDTSELAWQRDDPTAHQVQVHQATGMIIAQLGASAEIAFARLRAYAYAHDRRLGDVARDVVERRLRFEPDSLRESMEQDEV